jgi:hypothetical protein
VVLLETAQRRQASTVHRVRGPSSSNSSHYRSGRADTGDFEIDPYKETASGRQVSQGSYFDDPALAYACKPFMIQSEWHVADISAAASGSIGSAWADRPQPDANPYESPAPYRSPSREHTTPENTYVNPYPPSAVPGSSRSTDPPSSRRLALVTPQADSETDAGTYTGDVVIPPDTERKERRRPRPQPRNGVVQETDAGRVALVPPSYDPAWAQDGFTNDSPPLMSSRGGSQTDLDGGTEMDSLVRARSPGEVGETNSTHTGRSSRT